MQHMMTPNKGVWDLPVGFSVGSMLRRRISILSAPLSVMLVDVEASRYSADWSKKEKADGAWVGRAHGIYRAREHLRSRSHVFETEVSTETRTSP